MQLFGNRSLAWVLKWITDAAILFLLIILVWVLVYMRTSPPGGQLPFLLDLELPNQIFEPTSAETEVTGLVSAYTQITFRMESGSWQGTVLGVSGMVVGFGVLVWILWLLRMILSSLVARQPLTSVNGRRFRSIGLLLLFNWVFGGLWRISAYFYLQQHFQLPPFPGYFRLFREHFELTNLFLALLILLMAEILRLGAEYRTDSEKVI